ncbi:MAG: DNA alkylation repair protein [Deltaproteobacteria bacterium]|nr:DNA alkylation repair protein [Deltaproteobacteria bacterium]
MAEPLKTFFSTALVERLAGEIARVDARFAAAEFVAHASAGLESLELLDRARHIAAALTRHLPPAYPDAIEVLLASLGAEHASDELLGAGMAPFFYLPHVVFVAECGLEHFEISMRAQHELTRRFTAEFSIRPYLARHPERTLDVLRTWAFDPNPHVRRQVSEGTRLRLPWAARVPWLDAHPERVLALLELLRDDPTTLVRRSVANNLNDLGKVHAALLHETCARWLAEPSPSRRALVEHALRSAVKRGDPAALALLGYGHRASVAIEDVTIRPARVAIGGEVRIGFALVSRSRAPQELLVDLAVHFVKASGRAAPKVFKLRRLTLAPRERVPLSTAVSLAVHTTRKPRPGTHRVDVLINGEAKAIGAFEVKAEPEGRRRPASA